MSNKIPGKNYPAKIALIIAALSGFWVFALIIADPQWSTYEWLRLASGTYLFSSMAFWYYDSLKDKQEK